MEISRFQVHPFVLFHLSIAKLSTRNKHGHACHRKWAIGHPLPFWWFVGKTPTQESWRGPYQHIPCHFVCSENENGEHSHLRMELTDPNVSNDEYRRSIPKQSFLSHPSAKFGAIFQKHAYRIVTFTKLGFFAMYGTKDSSRSRVNDQHDLAPQRNRTLLPCAVGSDQHHSISCIELGPMTRHPCECICEMRISRFSSTKLTPCDRIGSTRYDPHHGNHPSSPERR